MEGCISEQTRNTSVPRSLVVWSGHETRYKEEASPKKITSAYDVNGGRGCVISTEIPCYIRRLLEMYKLACLASL